MMWNEFHTDPRKSYYLFLRRGYSCSALTAYAKVKSIDAMVAALQQDPEGTKAGILGTVSSSLRGYAMAAKKYAEWATRSIGAP